MAANDPEWQDDTAYGELKLSAEFWRPRFLSIRDVGESTSASLDSQAAAVNSLRTVMADTTSTLFFIRPQQEQERVVIAWVDAEFLEMLEAHESMLWRVGNKWAKPIDTLSK